MVKSLAILRESKTDALRREVESRVVLIPPQIKIIHDQDPQLEIFVEKDAGAKIDFADSAYQEAGASICSHDETLAKELVIGVKETKLDDFPKLSGNIFLSFQHFAQSRERSAAALATNATFVALETMETIKDGTPFFPCLAPMSEAAAKIIARHADEFALLSKKVITSGLPETGLRGVKVIILGGGSVGKTAAEEFSERGCEVYLLEKSPLKLKFLTDYFAANQIRFPKVTVAEMTPPGLRELIRGAFFLVSAMYLSGKRPERMVTIDLLKIMASGGCVYPVDIDQGGGIEGIKETSILDPFNLPTIAGTEVAFFAPPNLPSLGARTTSEALGAVLLPYVLEIIKKGFERAAADSCVINSGINIQNGKIVHPGLASVFPILGN